MPSKKKLKQQLLVTGCAAIVACSTGCRSAMPKWSMFGMRKSPSAEMLAGNGPTHTYPAPPSESSTPSAIASVAAGTGNQLAGAPKASGPSNGFGVGTPNVNMAAAQANGFAVASNRTTNSAKAASPPEYALSSNVSNDKNSAVPAIPAGYQFGTKGTQPTASAASPQSGSSYQIPSSYPAPTASTNPSAGSTQYQLPPAATDPIASTPSKSTATSYGLPPSSESGAFSLPDDVLESVKQAANGATNSAPFTPKADGVPAFGPTASGSITLPGATSANTVATGGSKPAFSTASATLPTGGSSLSLPSDGVESNSNSSGVYAPGSTGSSSGYPATSGYPTTGTDGSFYR